MPSRRAIRYAGTTARDMTTTCSACVSRTRARRHREARSRTGRSAPAGSGARTRHRGRAGRPSARTSAPARRRGTRRGIARRRPLEHEGQAYGGTQAGQRCEDDRGTQRRRRGAGANASDRELDHVLAIGRPAPLLETTRGAVSRAPRVPLDEAVISLCYGMQVTAGSPPPGPV